MLAGVLATMGYGTFIGGGNLNWKVPALTSAWFWGFSAYTIYQEGVVAVWNNHNQNFWGNQVWFDLLYSVALWWFALLPRAKAVGMPILPWFVYSCATASIGGLHFYARILYLEEQQRQQDDKNGAYTDLK